MAGKAKRRLIHLLKVCAVALSVLGSASVYGADIYIVQSRANGIHDAIARDVYKQLAQASPPGTGLHIVPPGHENELAGKFAKNDYVVTVGTQAYSSALATGTQAKIVATLIPRATYLALTRQAGRAAGSTSAVFIEQSFRRNLDLVKVALPGRTAGILVGTGSEELYEKVRTYQQKNPEGVFLRKLGKGENLVSALERVLSRSKVFIAYADPEVSNRTTAQHVLLTSYRHGIPVIGYSRAYVRAGAMMAVYSKPEQYARQVAEIVRDSLASNRPLPEPRFPKYFSVEVNPNVAHSLNIRLKPVAEIERQLKAMAVPGE